jgi:hypothetical protein
VNVLVVFYSCRGETERLALAAGVGAIQARANIRLRRLPPDPKVESVAMSASERENFERMSRDYTTPRPIDAEWADALIVASSQEGLSHVEAYLEGLRGITSHGFKVVAPLAADAASDSLEARHAFGRHVVALARALKGEA